MVVRIGQRKTAMNLEADGTRAEARSQEQVEVWLLALTNLYETSREALRAFASRIVGSIRRCHAVPHLTVLCELARYYRVDY